MITSEQLFNFFVVKDNYDEFLKYNPNFKINYEGLFDGFVGYELKKSDYKRWITRCDKLLNLSVLVDFFEKFNK